MNPSIELPTTRGRFDGMRQIARYNWPQYAGSAAVMLVAAAWLWLAPDGSVWLRAGAWIAASLAVWWCAASLVASHWIYDRSELYRWTWIPAALPAAPRRWLNLHAGLDESSAALRRIFPNSDGTTGDFFDGTEMSEPSIGRARKEQASAPAARRVNHRALPFADGTFDAVFLLFAAHELRRAAGREAFLREVRRVLAPSGTVLLVEHPRDAANFAAFGPGFFHFLPAGEWRRLARMAGLEITREYKMTPFVTVMLLQRTP